MLYGWNKLPVIVRAVLNGIVFTAVATIPWALLVKLNLKFYSSAPWSIVPMIIYLWLFWKYVKGEGWPRSTSVARNENLRANKLSAELWGAAILAGVLGLVSLIFFQKVFNQMVRLPQQQIGDLEHVPHITVFFLIIMGSVVAGIVEEAGFRGYMQQPIEKRYGPFIAICITGIFFGLAHFLHPETTLLLMPFYFYVAVIYGMLAYFTQSIYPGMALHIGGDIWVAFIFLISGQSEWQTSPASAPLIWKTGITNSFILSCIAFVLSVLAAVWAYQSLKNTAGKH